MPSKGSPRITLRIPEPWYSYVLETIAKNNLTCRGEEWTMVSWIVDAVRDKIAHQERAKVQQEKRKALRAGRIKRLAVIEAKAESAESLNSGSQNSLPTQAQFDLTWRALAERSVCDGFGGMQYQRVRQEWLEAGRPRSIGGFIRTRANIGPRG
jgi:hypothetical protein